MLLKRQTIFDLLNEADDDQNAGDTSAAEETPEAPAPEESGEDAGGDDDFDIDTSLTDDDNAGGDESSDSDDGGDESSDSDDGGDDFGSDDSGSSDDSSSSSSEEGEEDKEIPANTDIFASLTPEEQQIKIMELKRLFNELYTSINDILERINQTNTDENNIEAITNISSSLFYLRKYLSDYITKIFPNKSYIENDIAFNRYLSIVNGITSIIEEIGAIRMAKLGKK